MNAGVYTDLDEATYHADKGSLSASGAKRLLACPAKFHYERQHGQPPKREFDFGHAAHAKVLGVGAEIVTVEAENWRTKAAQEKAKEARAEGKVPLLAEEVARVDAMAAALREHPTAAALLAPESGQPEVSLFWDDPAHGIQRRCRVDWLREPVDGRLILVDYKSCISADPKKIAKAVADFGYHLSAAWYQDVVVGLGLAADAPFLLIFQEKTAPYLVTVVELDAEALRVGRRQADYALQLYRECTETGTWPAYVADDEIPLISLPAWATYVSEERVA